MALPATLQNMLAGYTASHQTTKAASGAGGSQFMRFQKDGTWVFGPDAIEVEEGSLWAIDPASFVHGFVSWETDNKKPSEKHGEVMVSAMAPPVTPQDLPDSPCAWKAQVGCSLLCIEGEDEGTVASYTASSLGGTRAVNDILGHIIQRLRDGETDELIPVVTLESDSYIHKRHGKIYTPEVSISKWAKLSSNPADTVKGADVKEDVKEIEPPPQEETTTRRRRRRAA